MSELDNADFFSAIDRITGANGAELLGEIRATFNRFVVLPSEHAVVAVVLWTVATHALSAFEHATRLAIHSATKRCGKSRLLEVLNELVHHALATTDASVAALFRIIEAAGDRPPTLLLDEADRLFGSARADDDNRDLIKLLNNGFRQGSPTWRCVGPQQTPTPFGNYSMAAVAGIGRLPDTIEDRAVNITMRRRSLGETVSKFRLKTDVPALRELHGRIGAWVDANLPALEKPVSDIPSELEDRAEDAWEPLLAVADAAGGEWPKLARAAAVALSKQAAEDESESLHVRLLHDVQNIFASMPHVGFLSTTLLLGELRKVDEAPWHDVELTSRKLASWMKDFEIKPRHNTAKTERGYHLEDLLDAFARYPQSGDASGSVQPVRRPETLAYSPDGSNSPDGSTSPDAPTRPATPPGNAGLDGSDGSGRVDPADTCRACSKPPRLGCLTCFDHMTDEMTYREIA
jgi:hypothetical protein